MCVCVCVCMLDKYNFIFMFETETEKVFSYCALTPFLFSVSELILSLKMKLCFKFVILLHT